MIKTISKLFIVFSLCSLLVSSLLASDEDFKNKGKGRLIFGFGIQFDPNALGGTIIKDGLTSNQPTVDADGLYNGNQQAIIPDNRLQVLETITYGQISHKSSGPMTAGSLTLGYEKDVGDNFFWRAGLNLSTKIMGGHTTSTVAGYDWYDVTFHYKSAVVPVFFGIKLNVGQRSAFYMAPGVHYYQAQWQLKGTNDRQSLDIATNNLTQQVPVLAQGASPRVYKEDAAFKGHGFGMSWLMGVHTKVTESGYAFIEVETHFSYTMDSARSKSGGGTAALAPQPAYPVSVAGNVYRFGYKHEI